jgi:hypothetical protein
MLNQVSRFTLWKSEVNKEKYTRKEIKDTGISTCQDPLVPVKCEHKEWTSIETLSNYSDRKAKKTHADNSRARAEKAICIAQNNVQR